MDEKFFLKKIDCTRFIARLFPLNIIERESKVWVNISWEYFIKSYEYVFCRLIISLGSKLAFNWMRMKKNC